MYVSSPLQMDRILVRKYNLASIATISPRATISFNLFAFFLIAICQMAT